MTDDSPHIHSPNRLERALDRLDSPHIAVLLFTCLAACIAYDFFLDSRCQRLACKGDFPAFYAAAALAGEPTLYISSAQAAFQHQHWPALEGQVQSFAYPPFTALILSPLALLPPTFAKIAFVVSNFCALTLAVFCFVPVRSRISTLILLTLVPTNFISLVAGQNTGISFLLLASALAAKTPHLRGLALGLLWLKPQFALIASVGWLYARAWRSLASSILVLATLVLASLIIQGSEIWAAWIVHLQQFAQLETQANGDRVISLVSMNGDSIAASLVPVARAMVLLLLSIHCLRRIAAGQSGHPQITHSRMHGQQILLIWVSALVLLAPRTMYYDFGLCLIPLVVGFSERRKELLGVLLLGTLALLPEFPLSAQLLTGLAIGAFCWTSLRVANRGN